MFVPSTCILRGQTGRFGSGFEAGSVNPHGLQPRGLCKVSLATGPFRVHRPKVPTCVCPGAVGFAQIAQRQPCSMRLRPPIDVSCHAVSKGASPRWPASSDRASSCPTPDTSCKVGLPSSAAQGWLPTLLSVLGASPSTGWEKVDRFTRELTARRPYWQPLR